MNNVFLKNIVRFVLLILLQVMVLNKMNLSGYINPYAYLLFILLLPVNINRSVLLILAFLTGLTIDVFGNTLGLHAAATVLLAFLRPGVINLFFSNIEFTGEDEPGLPIIGIGGFFRYTLVLVFIHHAFLFFLEVFSLSNFVDTLYRIIFSTLVTTLVIMIIVLLFTRKSK
jgi:rod shape-determining protein MreD